MKGVFVDANVLLEVLLEGRRHAAEAETALASIRDETVISPLSVHQYVHFGLKYSLPLNRLLDAISEHHITTFGPAEIRWATENYQNNDFEDALQVACALSYGCSSIVTFDTQLAYSYNQFIDITLLNSGEAE